MVITDECIGCTECADVCKFGAIDAGSDYNFVIDLELCKDCGE